MILGLGLMVSVYLIFLSLPGSLSEGISKLKNHFISRVTILVMVVYLLFIMDSLFHWQGDVVFLDGLSRISATILTGEIYLMVLAILTLGLLQHRFLVYKSDLRPEYYLLILSNLIGLIYLISSNDWLVTITAWELFNLTLYLLLAINTQSESTLSAAIKYFLLSSLSSVIMLLGIALIYGLTGSTHYDNITLYMSMLGPDSGSITSSYYEIGLPLLLISLSICFKLGLFPVHNTVIDVYSWTPYHSLVWIIHVSKLGTLLFLMMIFTNFFPTHLSGIESFYIFVGTSSIIAGYIGLGYQWQIRRFLTYSSCANMGFIVLAIACLELDSALFYSVVYFLSSMTIFGVLLVLSYLNGREILFINQLRGLFNQNQTLAIVLSLALFSLAGVPILSGFVAKLIVLQAYLNNGWIWVSIIAVISSVISAAYYLYIVKISLFDLSASKIKIKVPIVSSYILALLTTISIFLIFKASLLILSSQLLFINDFTNSILG